jgi:dTDP-4-dehydrorhamnose reductase
LLRIAETGTTGLYHVSGPEAVDRLTFAKTIGTVFGFDLGLLSATTSADIGQAANRPMNSAFVTLRFEAEFRHRLSTTEKGVKRLLQQYRDGERHADSLLTAEM